MMELNGNHKAFGLKMKELRDLAGLSKLQFSRQIELNRESSGKLERGEQRSIDIDSLFKIVKLSGNVVKERQNKELQFFEKCLKEDRELLSRFFLWSKINKDYVGDMVF